MKKIIFVFCFIGLLSLFLGSQVLAQQECYCEISTLTCVDTTPSNCPAGQRCECEAELDPFSGTVVSCYPGECVEIPPEGVCPGTCDVYCELTETEYESGNAWCTSQRGEPSICCLYQGQDPDDPWMPGLPPIPCGDGDGTGIQTALGCIPSTDTGQFVAWLVKLAIGIGGGIALLLMILAGFQIITSSGDPQKLQAGKELLSAAIAGLLLIIFSIFLLELIGVRILNIPGLG